MSRVVFDLETEPFTEAFKAAQTLEERVAHAPRLRLGCAYVEDRDEYRYYDPEQTPEPINVLRDAGEVVTFNGNRFDLLVLARHHGLRERLPAHGGHVDLCEILSGEVGFNVGLWGSAVCLKCGSEADYGF